MVQIGVWALKCLLQPIFRLGVGTNLAWPKPTFRTQIEYVRTYSGHSQHLNPSNHSPLVYWMVTHDWDLNSTPTTITTPWLLSHGWWKFRLGSLHFASRLSVYRLIQLFHISSTHPISHNKYNEWLDKVEICVWALKWSPQSIFQPWEGTNSAWPKLTFWNPDCVCTDWFMQFSAPQPFQCVIISILNGCARLRFEFILQNRHHTPAF